MNTKHVAATKAEAKQHLRENEKKWGKEVLALGWSMIPNILLLKQEALSLEPIDINIILQIAKHWWRAGETPFPSHKTLAREMSIDVSTVKRHLARLRADGLIDWKQRARPDKGQLSNAYDFSGLIAKLRPHAIEAIKERREADERKKALARRKRPKLHIVPPTKDRAR